MGSSDSDPPFGPTDPTPSWKLFQKKGVVSIYDIENVCGLSYTQTGAVHTESRYQKFCLDVFTGFKYTYKIPKSFLGDRNPFGT